MPHVKLRCPLALTGFNAHATKENTHLVTTNLAKKLKTQPSVLHVAFRKTQVNVLKEKKIPTKMEAQCRHNRAHDYNNPNIQEVEAGD